MSRSSSVARRLRPRSDEASGIEVSFSWGRIIDRMPVISFAVTDLQHHHQVVLGAYSQPLRFKQLPLLLESVQPLPKLYLNPLHRREHGSNPDTTFKAVRSLGTVAGGTLPTYPYGAHAGHGAFAGRSREPRFSAEPPTEARTAVPGRIKRG